MQWAIWERGASRMNRLVKLNQSSRHYIWEKGAFRTKQFIKLIWLSNICESERDRGPFRWVCLIIPSGLRLKEWCEVGLHCYSLEKIAYYWKCNYYCNATKKSGSVSNVAASICSQLRMFIFSTHFNYHSEIWTSDGHILT